MTLVAPVTDFMLIVADIRAAVEAAEAAFLISEGLQGSQAQLDAFSEAEIAVAAARASLASAESDQSLVTGYGTLAVAAVGAAKASWEAAQSFKEEIEEIIVDIESLMGQGELSLVEWRDA